jgi:hypothetical protein
MALGRTAVTTSLNHVKMVVIKFTVSFFHDKIYHSHGNSPAVFNTHLNLKREVTIVLLSVICIELFSFSHELIDYVLIGFTSNLNNDSGVTIAEHIQDM